MTRITLKNPERPPLSVTKNIVASSYYIDSWQEIIRQMNLGIGIGKLFSMESIMDQVAEEHANICNAREPIKIDVDDLRECLLSLDKKNFSSYSRESAEVLVPFIENITPGTYFLCDLIGGQINLCKATKRPYKVEGRSVKAKLIATIVEDCHKTFGTALNGEWAIPYYLISPKTKEIVEALDHRKG